MIAYYRYAIYDNDDDNDIVLWLCIDIASDGLPTKNSFVEIYFQLKKFVKLLVV